MLTLCYEDNVSKLDDCLLNPNPIIKRLWVCMCDRIEYLNEAALFSKLPQIHSKV